MQNYNHIASKIYIYFRNGVHKLRYSVPLKYN